MKKSIGLQAIRGIAVALVVIFHMGFTPFRNGWIGVDIFFVLSGFLMWELYRQSILDGQVKDFYLRRLRRLLPALAILLIFSSFVFFIRFLPFERQLLFSEATAANLFVSNINYWMGDQYFSNGSLRPLLNLWSIALEIQFYLFFPLIVLIIKRSTTRLLFLFAISFTSFVFLSQISPQTNFFLLPGRLWEFLAGMLVGSALQVKLNYRPNFNLTLIFCLIFLGLTIGLTLDGLQTVVFQTVTVGLFSLLIWGGWSSRDRNIFSAALGKLGDYSYSVYLIHFPLIVLVSYQPFLGNPHGISGFRSLLFFICLLILLTWLSKHFVEDSVFLKTHFVKLWGVSFALSALLLILQPTIVTFGFNEKEVVISNAVKDRGNFRCGILLRLPFLNDPSKTCLLTKGSDDRKRVLLMGNSHANAIKEAVVAALPNRSIYLLNENNPLGAANVKTYEKAIANLHPQMVILHSSAGSTDLDALKGLIAFTRNKSIDFVVIDPVPSPGFDVPSIAYSLLNSKDSLISFEDPKFTIDSYSLDNKGEINFYSRLNSVGEIIQIPVADLFCSPFCQIVDSRTLKPFYFDYGHLTKTGAFKLIPRIQAVIG